MRATYVLIARIPPGRLELFMEYERHVLPLLEEHEGMLELRVRTHDECVEVHVVSFPSSEAFAAYRSDPRRARHQRLLSESRANTELLGVFDVLTRVSDPQRDESGTAMRDAAS